jgi:hypothetical protein
MQRVEAYFDESGTHDGSPVLCLGGFVVEHDAARRLDADWEQMLAKYDIPFFHMTDCANGADIYAPLGIQGRIEVASEAIQLIRKHMINGRMTSIYPRDFHVYAPDHEQLGSAYSMCAHGCLAGVQSWADHAGFYGKIDYFFESGHKSQNEANRIMAEIFKQPALRQRHRYSSHAFADKRKIRPLQAADIIAWHWFTENKRRLERKRPNMRADTIALMGPNESGAEFISLHYDPDNIKRVARPAFADKYPLTYPGLL